MRICFVSILSLVVFTSYGQRIIDEIKERWIPGCIVDSQGELITGNVLNGDLYKSSKAVVVKTDDGKKRKFSAKKAKGYMIGDVNYEIIDYVYWLNYKTNQYKAMSRKPKPVMYQVMEKGKNVDLYAHYYKYSEKQGNVTYTHFEVDYLFKKNKDDKLVFVPDYWKKNFNRFVESYFGDNKTISKKARGNEYKYKNILEIVREYNK